jgi:hypothetical protein
MNSYKCKDKALFPNHPNKEISEINIYANIFLSFIFARLLFSVQCLLVEFDEWTAKVFIQSLNETTPQKKDTSATPDDPYVVKVPCRLMEAKYAKIVDAFKIKSASAKKGMSTSVTIRVHIKSVEKLIVSKSYLNYLVSI